MALVGDVYCNFVIFPCGFLGQMWYLIVSFPEFRLLSSFQTIYKLNHNKIPALIFPIAEEV